MSDCCCDACKERLWEFDRDAAEIARLRSDLAACQAELAREREDAARLRRWVATLHGIVCNGTGSDTAKTVAIMFSRAVSGDEPNRPDVANRLWIDAARRVPHIPKRAQVGESGASGSSPAARGIDPLAAERDHLRERAERAEELLSRLAAKATSEAETCRHVLPTAVDCDGDSRLVGWMQAMLEVGDWIRLHAPSALDGKGEG